MYKKKKILAVIPARGGSKGVPRKNIKTLGGKPLLLWTLQEARKSKFIDRCIVSTEDREISEVAKLNGGEVPFLRPQELAMDDTATIDVILDVLEKIPGYDYIVLLQPTSPLRTVDDIDGAIVHCIDNNAVSCVSVVETEHSPYWMYVIFNGHKMKPLLDNTEYESYQRQKLPSIYRLNGAVYVNSCAVLIKEQKFVGRDTIAYIMSQENSCDIDTLTDFMIAESLIKNRKC